MAGETDSAHHTRSDQSLTKTGQKQSMNGEKEQQLHQRIEELETRMAFQDDLLHSLNEQLGQQQLSIHELWEAKQQLQKQIEELHSPQSRHNDQEPPPPHY